MSTPLEHDYIGLSELPSMENPVANLSPNPKSSNFALKTDLSLRLPGFESPERKIGSGVTIFGKEFEEKTLNGYSIGSLKASASGAKRGFSDAIDGCEQWVFSINGKSDTNLSKDGCLYSPKSGQNGKNLTDLENNRSQKFVQGTVPITPKPVQEKQKQVSGANEHGNAPSAK